MRGALGEIDRTPAMPVPDASRAAVQVHVTVCRRDVRLAAVTLKSLLRYAPAAVCLTDDGTLTREDRRWLGGHLPGAKWMDRRSDDPRVAEALLRRPALRRFYEGELPMAAKLLHPVAAADCPRVVVLDPDTAFFERPDQLLDWMAAGRRSLYLHDRSKDAQRDVPPEAQAMLDAMVDAMIPACEHRPIHPFFNSGLLACFPSRLDLDAAEAFLRWREALPEASRQGRAGIWFGSWTREQMSYYVMLLRGEADAEAFDVGYRIGFHAGEVFNHFLGCNVTRRDVLAHVGEMVSRWAEAPGELARAG